MNKHRKRLIFLASLCFLIVLVLAIKRIAPTVQLFRPAPLMPFSDSSINRITLTGETKNQTLLRQKGAWVIPVNGVNFQADTDKVDNLLKTLHGITAESVVSRNKNKFADLGIGKSKIVLQADGKTYTLYVGSTAMGEDAYARLGNQNEVFVANNLGSVYLDGDYRDLRIPVISHTADVQSVNISYQGEATTLTQSGNTWHSGAGSPVSDLAVNRYLQDAANLQASDILQRTSAPAGDPELTITIKEKGKDKAVRFYQYNEQNLQVDIAGQKYLYAVPKVYVSSLEKRESDFIGPTTQP